MLAAAIDGVLLYRGLDAWSEATLHGPASIAVAALVGLWAVRIGPSQVERLLRIA